MARERRHIPLEAYERREQEIRDAAKMAPPHICDEHVEYIETDGALGQAWICGLCGTLLQVG